MGTWSQESGLAGTFADYKNKYGITDSDSGQQMLDKIKAKDPGLATKLNSLAPFGIANKLKQEYGVDQSNQQAYDATVAPQTLATQFRNNLGQTETNQADIAAQQARQGLAQSLANIRQNASNRGLLYSGLRQSSEAGARSGAASGLQSHIMGINQNLENTANQLEDSANQQSLGRMQGLINASGQALQQQNAAYAQQMGYMGQIGSGLGSLAGTYFGNQAGTPNKPGVVSGGARPVATTNNVVTSDNYGGYGYGNGKVNA